MLGPEPQVHSTIHVCGTEDCEEVPGRTHGVLGKGWGPETAWHVLFGGLEMTLGGELSHAQGWGWCPRPFCGITWDSSKSSVPPAS